MKTLLLAEDNEDDVFFMERAIQQRKLRCSLRIARDGEEVINYLTGEGVYANREAFPLPTLILLDIKMPRRNGHEVLEWIRGHEPLCMIPVIMLTSSNQNLDVNRAYRTGVNSYLIKPVNHHEFEETMQQLAHYWLQLN